MERRMTRAMTHAGATPKPVGAPIRKPLADLNANGTKPKVKKSKLNQLLTDDSNGENQPQTQGRSTGSVPAKIILNKEMAKVQPLEIVKLHPVTSGSDTQDEKEAEPQKQSSKPNKSEDIVFKKPAAPVGRQSRNNTKSAPLSDVPPKFFTASIQNGQIVRNVTYYESRFTIRPKICQATIKEHRHLLDFPLVKLANASSYVRLPSDKWCSKVILYKVKPEVLQRHTLTIYTGDLKIHKIRETERHKYQPSCVIFRRDSGYFGHKKRNVPFDRVIIFRHMIFTVSIDSNLVNLNGAPDAISSLSDVHKLLDIVDSITLPHPMIEIVKHNKQPANRLRMSGRE